MRFITNYLMILLVGVIISCQSKSDFRTEKYFQLDSLLESQSILLSEKKMMITKSVKMDGQFEEISFQPDTSRWMKEFKILGDFSLNKTTYIGAFSLEKNGKSVTYTKKDGQPIPINKFEVLYNKELSLVSGQYFEDKDIFQHERNFELRFDESGLLSKYKIWGFQKMILQDTIRYDISGKITPELK